MRVMLFFKAAEGGEATEPTPEALEAFEAMDRFTEELVQAGVFVAAAGLKPTEQSKRVIFDGRGNAAVVDGPFTESKELIAGYTMIQVRSREEALEWSRRFPSPFPGAECEIEVRQLFESEDFGESPAMDRFKELGMGGTKSAA